jgi:hypothetical protein
LALHPGSSVNGRLLPALILAVRRHGFLRPSQGLLRRLPPSARGLSSSSLGLQRLAFHGHCFGNSASLGFSTCQQEDNGISHCWCYDYS